MVLHDIERISSGRLLAIDSEEVDGPAIHIDNL